MGRRFCPDGRKKMITMTNGSGRHSGIIYAATMTLLETMAQRMLRRKLSGGGGSRMAILLMVVRSYHFDHWLVVGSQPSKK
jgi:hypothetical protein